MPDKVLTLRLLTPSGVAASVECDSIQLVMRPDTEGQKGGLVGIRRDHTASVLALDRGPVLASREGLPILRASVSGGFASVQDNVVTVLSDDVRLEEAQHRSAEVHGSGEPRPEDEI